MNDVKCTQTNSIDGWVGILPSSHWSYFPILVHFSRTILLLKTKNFFQNSLCLVPKNKTKQKKNAPSLPVSSACREKKTPLTSPSSVPLILIHFYPSLRPGLEEWLEKWMKKKQEVVLWVLQTWSKRNRGGRSRTGSGWLLNPLISENYLLKSYFCSLLYKPLGKRFFSQLPPIHGTLPTGFGCLQNKTSNGLFLFQAEPCIYL